MLYNKNVDKHFHHVTYRNQNTRITKSSFISVSSATIIVLLILATALWLHQIAIYERKITYIIPCWTYKSETEGPNLLPSDPSVYLAQSLE